VGCTAFLSPELNLGFSGYDVVRVWDMMLSLTVYTVTKELMGINNCLYLLYFNFLYIQRTCDVTIFLSLELNLGFCGFDLVRISSRDPTNCLVIILSGPYSYLHLVIGNEGEEGGQGVGWGGG